MQQVVELRVYVIRGILSLWRVTSKKCWVTTDVAVQLWETRIENHIASGNVIPMKDNQTFTTG